MTSSQKPIRIGPYVAGEIPLASVFQFLDHDGNPIDISGYSASVVLAPTGQPTLAVTRTASVSAGPLGEVTYTWSAADIPAAGSYELQFWAGNGSVRLASPLHLFSVVAGAGTAPSI